MSLLIPETGLLFWKALSFGIVFFILAKYAWPAIIGMVERRSDFIEESVKMAEEARLQLDSMRATSESIITEARKKQLEILQEGNALKSKMIEEAKHLAAEEADKIIHAAHIAIQKEKEEALNDVRRQVAVLSLEIAEKVVRQKLEAQGEQTKLVEKLLDEMIISNN